MKQVIYKSIGQIEFLRVFVLKCLWEIYVEIFEMNFHGSRRLLKLIHLSTPWQDLSVQRCKNEAQQSEGKLT